MFSFIVTSLKKKKRKEKNHWCIYKINLFPLLIIINFNILHIVIKNIVDDKLFLVDVIVFCGGERYERMKRKENKIK